MSDLVRYEIQWDRETYLLAERAARLSGASSVKAYVIHLVKQHAPEAMRAYSSTRLTNEAFDAFCRACDNPPALSTEILEAARALDSEGLSVSVREQ